MLQLRRARTLSEKLSSPDEVQGIRKRDSRRGHESLLRSISLGPSRLSRTFYRSRRKRKSRTKARERLLERRFGAIGVDAARASMFAPSQLENLSTKLVKACRRLPHIANMCVSRTWTNGWFASHRMHHLEPPPCIFGCTDAKDELKHYLKCSSF